MSRWIQYEWEFLWCESWSLSYHITTGATSHSQPFIFFRLNLSLNKWSERIAHHSARWEKNHLNNSGFDIIMHCHDKWASGFFIYFFNPTEALQYHLNSAGGGVAPFRSWSGDDKKPMQLFSTILFICLCSVWWTQVFTTLSPSVSLISNRDLFLQASHLIRHAAVIGVTRSSRASYQLDKPLWRGNLMVWFYVSSRHPHQEACCSVRVWVKQYTMEMEWEVPE